MDSEDKGNIGIDKLSIAIRTMGYKFRRQLESDYGIDAHIEIRENEQYPTGKLIGVQVKTDKSDCTEAKDHYNFNSDYEHLNYWLNHSLPVIIVHYDIEKDILNWVQVKEDKITRNKKSWSIKIPKSNFCINRIESFVQIFIDFSLSFFGFDFCFEAFFNFSLAF